MVDSSGFVRSWVKVEVSTGASAKFVHVLVVEVTTQTDPDAPDYDPTAMDDIHSWALRKVEEHSRVISRIDFVRVQR